MVPRLVRRRWIYPSTTLAVGVMWYVAFLVAPGGWDLMTQPHMGLADPSLILPFLCFPMTSFLVGTVSRPIFEWTGKGIAVITGLSGTFVGSIFYVWLLVVLADSIGFVHQGVFEELSRLTWSGALAMTCIGPVIALQYGFVTVPAAVGSGLLLRWASRVAEQALPPSASERKGIVQLNR